MREIPRCAQARVLLQAFDMPFITRTDAGRQLATVLRSHVGPNSIVVGITRGGVAVAAEAARELGAPLDICVVRKLQAPDGHAFGCICERDGLFVDQARIEQLRLSSEKVTDIIAREGEEVARLSTLYRDRPALALGGRDLIVIDDGLISSATVFAVVRSLRQRGARSIELAVPVADRRAVEEVSPALDHVTALEVADPLASIGACYSELLPVSDAEVIELMADSHRGGSALRRAVSHRAH